jgi:hypothetical protein
MKPAAAFTLPPPAGPAGIFPLRPDLDQAAAGSATGRFPSHRDGRGERLSR